MKKPMVAVAALCVLAAGAAWYFSSQSNNDPPVEQAESQSTTNTKFDQKAVAPAVAKPGFAMIGGVERPESDVRFADDSERPVREPPRKRQGLSPAVDPASNEQAKLVADALKSRDKPERFSSFLVKRSFDANKFQSDPEGYAKEYAAVVEPGRVFAPAQPGEGVEVLRADSKRFHRVKQGESVRLVVEAVPNAPVTFSSQDLGQFGNELTSVTVVANEQGVATANYTASGGTIDEVQILAASPVTTGQVSFTVSVNVDG